MLKSFCRFLALAMLVGTPAVAAVDWCSYLGGSDGDTGAALVQIGGDIVVAGYTTSDDFPATPGAWDLSRNPGGVIGRDAFIARFSGDGTTLPAGSYLGGSGEDLAIAAATLPTGEVAILGQTDSSDFPVTEGAPFPSPGGGIDLFLAVFDPAGATLVRSTYFGGGGNDFPRALLVEPDGAVVILGDSNSDDLPVAESRLGPTDLFVARFNPAGGFQSARLLGGSGNESGGGIVRDPLGSLWIGAGTTSTDIPSAQGSHQGGYDAVVFHLSADLTTLNGSSYLGGGEDDRSRAIAVTPDGLSVLLFGTTSSDDFPVTAGAIQTVRRGRDLFVTRFNRDLATITASTLFGTGGTDSAYRIRTDDSGAAVLTGAGFNGGMPTTPGAADLDGKPGCNPYCFSDVLLARLNATLTRVQYATYMASSNGDTGYDFAGTVQVGIGGSSGGGDFPSTPGAWGEEWNLGLSSSASDAFASRLDLTASMPAVTMAPTEILWDGLSGSAGYDVIRGNLHLLREDGGTSTRSVELCLAESTTTTTVPLTGDPAVGEAWYYLVRSRRTGTPTSYDAISTSQRGSRDDRIDASPDRCN